MPKKPLKELKNGETKVSLISERIKRLRERAKIMKETKGTEDIVKDFNEAADLIEEISAKLSARNVEESNSTQSFGGWIPCIERLPEKGIPVLTCDRTGWISVNINNSYVNIKNDFECGYYVAWMELPEAYKE